MDAIDEIVTLKRFERLIAATAFYRRFISTLITLPKDFKLIL